MAKKRVSKSVKRRLTFLGPILLGIVIFCIFTIFSYAYQIHQLKLEEQKLESELKAKLEEISKELGGNYDSMEAIIEIRKHTNQKKN